MAINNRDRIGKALELLSEGIYDDVDEIMTKTFQTRDWNKVWARQEAEKYGSKPLEMAKNDVQTQLRAITEFGRYFNGLLSRSQQAYASELRDVRAKWAHMEPFTSDETIRALSTIELLLSAMDVKDSAADVRRIRDSLQRTVYEDHTRKISQNKTLMVAAGQGMKPWREVIRPHDDVASGRFTASEFAADLYQVAFDKSMREPGNAYGDPVEFFNRTYLTEGLKDLLTRAVKRLEGDNSGSPVVNLQTNFGGGKTHSLLALYHLFGDTSVSKLSSDVQDLVSKLGVEWEPGNIRRVALVGTKLNAGKPDVKPDGTEVRTIWGELAWQLGGREAYDLVSENDRNGTNPGHLLDELLHRYGPCLILIDEWVAYAKQLVGHDDLPAGPFDNQFVFAQSLTEAVKTADHCMLVMSIPASDTGWGSDIEVGGENGQLALRELQNVVRRTADQWRPSTRDESFEIVRKRLFEEPDAEAQEQIALTARRFADMYRANPKAFPSDVTGTDYEKRIRASYPLHPELLDLLYEDWSSLETFQRTRGVLTLVSNIIHELWTSNDTSSLILPGNVPLDADSVNSNLTQYLHDPWKPIIDTDVAGSNSTPAVIDEERPALGQRHLTQRIARTIFMGSAPRANAQNPYVGEQNVRLGTEMPGDADGNFGIALSMLGQRSTYFFNEGARYRYSLQPSITKTARDYAERLREEPETVYNEITRRLKSEGAGGRRGSFRRVCVTPEVSDGIPDVDDATLVIMHPRHTVDRNSLRNQGASETAQWIRNAIERRGTAQRTNRNMVVFLVADKDTLEMAEDSARQYLGWKQVADREKQLNLTHQQLDQANDRKEELDRTLGDRIRNAYQWCVYPMQDDPASAYALGSSRVPDSGTGSMAERTGAFLIRNDMLVENYSGDNIGYEIVPNVSSAFHDGVLSAGELWGFITRFPYMPRMADHEVFDHAIEDVPNHPMEESNRFALASGRDPETGVFRNLIIPGVTEPSMTIQATDSTLLVDWDVAVAAHERDLQLQDAARTSVVDHVAADLVSPDRHPDSADTGTTPGSSASDGNPIAAGPVKVRKKRYYASVELDSENFNRQLAQLNEAILDQLRMGRARISMILDIQAENPDGFNDGIMNVIGENARSLGNVKESGFEED